MLLIRLRPRWYRLLGAGPLALLLALAPAVLYFDHWAEFAGHAQEQSAQEEARHETHCHIGAASCSEQPLPASVSVIPLLIDLPEPELQMTALEEVTSILSEIVIAPPNEPPRL
jgi:hypothetical protein